MTETTTAVKAELRDARMVMPPDALDTLRKLLLRRHEAYAAKKEAELLLKGDKQKGITGIDEKIQELMIDFDQDAVRFGQFAPKIIGSPRRTLNEALLLQNGVTADVIEASKKETMVTVFRVDTVKLGEGEAPLE